MLSNRRHQQAPTALWDRHRGRIRSSRGGWRIGSGVLFSGYSLYEDLLGQVSLFQVLILNVTGRLPQRRFADWLECAFMCVGWPDTRIWCNQIAAFSAEAETSPVAAVCAGTLASDSKLYGPGTTLACVEFIDRAMECRKEGLTPPEIVDRLSTARWKRGFPGYSRPIAQGDDRVQGMQNVADELGFTIGAHLRLAYSIHEVLVARNGESLNMAGYMTAFMYDCGYSAEEGYAMTSLLVNVGVHAGYADVASRTRGTFLPLRCDDVEYSGVVEREVPSDE